MIEQQQKLVLSPYMEIYELVVPKDNLLPLQKPLLPYLRCEVFPGTLYQYGL